VSASDLADEVLKFVRRYIETLSFLYLCIENGFSENGVLDCIRGWEIPNTSRAYTQIEGGFINRYTDLVLHVWAGVVVFDSIY
jgi:hypothetical protein